VGFIVQGRMIMVCRKKPQGAFQHSANYVQVEQKCVLISLPWSEVLV